MINKISKILQNQNYKFWDLRKENIEDNRVVAWNNQIKTLGNSVNDGVSFRIIIGNGIGFASTTNGNITKIVEDAVKIAKHVDRLTKKENKFYIQDQIKDEVETKVKVNPEDVSIEEKKDITLELSKKEDKIATNTTIYMDAIKNKEYYNSENSEIKQKLIYSYIGNSITAKEGNKIETYDIRNGHQGGFEITEDFEELVKNTKQKAIELLNAEIPKGGRFPVIADGVLTDVFIHEALGHAAEADHILQKESILDGYMNEKIAEDFVNVIEDPTIPNSWGSYFYDDEGIKSKKTTMIENGILKRFIHNRTSAATLNMEPTGNGRAQSFEYLPQVRMSNTYIKNGNYKFDEILEDIKEGIYLKGSQGGEVDTATGSFQFSAQEGYMIKNGELTKPLKQVSLSGSTLNTLKNISKITKEYDKGFPGFCGKNGQRVPVIGHCPQILINDAIVGGRK